MILFCSLSQWVISTETLQCFYRMKNGRSELFSNSNIIIIVIIIIIIIIKNINTFFQLMFTLFCSSQSKCLTFKLFTKQRASIIFLSLAGFLYTHPTKWKQHRYQKTPTLSVSFFYLTHKHTHIIFFVNAQVYQWASLYSLQCLTDPAHRGRVLLRKTR